MKKNVRILVSISMLVLGLVWLNAAVVADCLPTATGGNDTITCDTTIDSASGLGGDDSILINANVTGSEPVYGDGVSTAGNDSLEISGAVGDVAGDKVTDSDGGDDNIILNSGATVSGNLVGDDTNDNGGDDSIFVAGSVSGDVFGDQINVDPFIGGADTIVIASGASIGGDVAGDGLTGNNARGGRDSILIQGTVTGVVTGDDAAYAGRSGRDTITIGSDGLVVLAVSGDRTKKGGSRDTITIDGTVTKSVFGDNTNRAGGNDVIIVNTTGVVKRSVQGDHVKRTKGGADTITIHGEVRQNISGDGFRTGGTGNGGDDVIVISTEALVKGDVMGDDAPGDGGGDSIIISGTVKGDVIGDKVAGTGGIDTIIVAANAVVEGDVIGDDAGTPATAGNGGDDVFEINGTVLGSVYLDNVGGPTLDVSSNADVPSFDLATGGSDMIVVAGHIYGNISSAHGSDGDDVFVVTDSGSVGGVMDAGSHDDGDRIVFNLQTRYQDEFQALSDIFNGLKAEDGKVSYRGNTYRWVNFEGLAYFIELLATRTTQVRCTGIYEFNDTTTACQKKGKEEVEAILFHRNNPGYDGRMPGTEACAIYNYGNAMRVYEVVDGSEGELVTTISADVFNHNMESNLLLASSDSGMVNVYYLTSNEVQVECTDWTGKTQVRIIPDFSGTVNASFDKAGG